MRIGQGLRPSTWGRKYYTDADALIDDAEIDAVYIATPPDSHLFYALKVASAGKACCIEKPLAPNYEESKKIALAFKKNNIPLFVAYYRRSLPRFTKIREWLLNHAIGDVSTSTGTSVNHPMRWIYPVVTIGVLIR